MSTSVADTSNSKVEVETSEDMPEEEMDLRPKKSKIENDACVVSEEADFDVVPQTEVPPEQLVFGIDLLHSMILEAMDDSDLLHMARLVNTHWHSVATKILQNRYKGSIRFDFDKKRSFWCRDILMEDDDFHSDEKNTLVALTALMSNSLTEHFPVTDFTFNSGSPDAFDFQQFFSIHGSHVYHLELSPFDDFNKTEASWNFRTIRTLLTQQVPNLLCLRWGHWRCIGNIFLESEELDSDNSTSSSKPIIPKPAFPKLVHIQTWPSENLVEFLRASPNLTRITLSYLDRPVFKYLIESGRLSLLKQDFIFDRGMWNWELEVHDKFADTKPKIEKIQVNLNPGNTMEENSRVHRCRIARCLEKILEASSESLENVTWITSGNLPRFTIPVLKNVKILTFTDSSGRESRSRVVKMSRNMPLFPPDSPKLASIFPNVTHAFFKYQQHFKKGWMEPVAIYSQPLLTVKTLSIPKLDNFSAEMITKLARLFPNVSKADFGGITNFPLVAKSIWKFLKMKELALEVKAFSYHNLYPGLDIGFTGLTTGAVKNLEVMSDNEEKEELDWNSLRKNPSVAHLKDLTSLKIKLTSDKQVKSENDGTSFITELSVDYAFRLLPELVVYISVRSKGTRSTYDQMLETLGEIVEYGRGQIILEDRRY